MKPSHILALIAFALPINSLADTVKLSKSKICHTTESSSYNRTKNFTPYDSLQQCLDAGGRLPKGFKSSQSETASTGISYERSHFGHGWDDADRDCQNSRMEALIAQSLSPVKFKDAKQCSVASGRWISPYSGKTIYKASEIDIDHVVPLKWSWTRGASNWTYAKREKFANDPANLLSVEASLNRQKGAKGLDDWLPPKNQCQYIVRFIRVAKTYGLTFSAGEMVGNSRLQDKYCTD